MFGKSFKSAKCKTTLRLAISRMKLIKNKSDLQLKQMRRDLAQLLQSGQEASARIRVEQIIREQNMMAARDFIELFCELIVARLPIIESQKNCPIDLREAISSLIFAAPRCADIPELIEIRSLFGSKYGKEFLAAAAELRPDCGVNRTIIEKLSVRTPSGEVKLKLMKEIAMEHQIDWDPDDSEKELLKPPEDMLGGPSKFVGATKMTIQSVKEPHQSVSQQKYEPEPQVSKQSTSGMPNSSRSSHSGVAAPYMVPSMTKIAQDFATSATSSVDNVKYEKGSTSSSVSLSSANIEHEQPSQASSPVKNVEYAALHQESLGERTSISMNKRNTFATNNTPVGKYASAMQSTSDRMDSRKEDIIAKSSTSSNRSNESGFLNSNSKEWNMNFKDAASAAQAAAYSADKACEAAKAAADLSNPKRFLKEGSTRPGVPPFSASQRDEESKDLSNSRMTRKPSSNDFMQGKEQSFDGHDLYGGDDVEIHAENAVSQESGNWQGSQEKDREKVDSEYELHVKRTSGIHPYQQPSDRINWDNTAPIGSQHIRREAKKKIGGKEEQRHVSRKDTDVSDSDEEFPPWRGETVISHTNTQPSTSFYDSVRLNAKRDEEVKLKRAEDSRNEVNEIKFDGTEKQRHVSKKDTDVSDSDEEFPHWRRETVISHTNSRPSARLYDSVRLNSKSAEEIELKHTEDSRNAVNDIKFDGKEEQHHVSSKDTDVSDSDEEFLPWRRETVISQTNTQPSTNFYDSVRLNSKSAEEIKLKLTEDSREAVNDTPQFDDLPHGEPSDIRRIPRYTEHVSVMKSSSFVEEHNQLYSNLPLSQPPKRPPPGVSTASEACFQSSLSNEKSPLGKVSTLYDALSDSSSNEDEQSGLMMRGKTSSTLNDSGTHFIEAHAKNGNSQSNLHLPKERSNRPDHYHQPSNRVYNHDKPSAGKSQRLRREETEQLGHSSPNMEETIPSISVEESPSRKGNLRSSRSKTPASYIFYDSDGTASESGEEIELERYNDRTSSKINKLPLFSGSSHGASSDFKHQKPKHAENFSAPAPNRVTESRIQSSRSNPDFQPLKQSLPSVIVSSQSTPSPLSVGGSETSRESSTKSGSHVHPKLPDYDNLAAMFGALKSNRR